MKFAQRYKKLLDRLLNTNFGIFLPQRTQRLNTKHTKKNSELCAILCAPCGRKH